ncbi:hypothetical protein HDIA_1184 [Hartmannibacter diazotrophicus]|uniref:DUF2207 domain-containing protein n=1 Tax=Hartmannibacter diazotrophicus TaxID=1482074 RepID=A0A2C9D5E1_9HYPH|nr:DUF2207 domain-containing protein [Hartmannibacter diazotrophicus]SON54725.1 hypothetical protein HDIA_1184 [Hartmannibacter diazotrophicus]
MKAILAALALVLALASPVLAEERIRSYDSRIDVRTDGLLDVTETITVDAEGANIKRGIYRDFPLIYVDENGKRHEVGFDILSVKRGGRDEPYFTNRNSDGIRIYIGDKDVLLSPGTYTYEIRYETSRQFRRFDDHDEVYWNVTGNDWAFPIDEVSAEIQLPDGARPEKWTAYTGYYGDAGSDYTASADGSLVRFRTTRPLAPREGFSVVVAIPKGVIAAPTAAQEAANFWLDNRNRILAAIVLAVIGVYYLFIWDRVGRDPPKDVVIPLFRAPEGVSPALAGYIHDMGFKGSGWTALSAAVVSLAVKGYLVLDNLGDKPVLERTDKPLSNDLPPGERAILTKLDVIGHPRFRLSRDNGPDVASIGLNFRATIEKENRGRFFAMNVGYAVLGIALSVVGVIAMFALGNWSADEVAAVIPFVAAGFILAIFAVLVGQLLGRGNPAGKIGTIVILFFLGQFVVTAASLGSAAMFDWMIANPFLPITLGIIVGLNVLFFILLRAPTVLGQKLMTDIEGLKLYLSKAESERMNMAGVPQMSPQHFETLLPYAIALGEEKPWTRAMEAWLATAAVAGAAAAAYSPGWYHGGSFDHGGLTQSLGSLGSSMSSSFQSSVPPPKSSSSGFSGGGGSSGGGGGGGGGGGW